MTNKTVIINHLGKEYNGEIATIKSTYLGNGDASRGIVSTNLFCEWKGGGIAVGGYTLDTPITENGKFIKREGTAYGLSFIMKILDTAGVESWEQLKNAKIIVLFDKNNSGWGTQAVGFAGLENEKVFIHSEFSEYWKAREND